MDKNVIDLTKGILPIDDWKCNKFKSYYAEEIQPFVENEWVMKKLPYNPNIMQSFKHIIGKSIGI